MMHLTSSCKYGQDTITSPFLLIVPKPSLIDGRIRVRLLPIWATVPDVTDSIAPDTSQRTIANEIPLNTSFRS
ncbi:hypothetical protein VTL71DRAFT_14165 [Oculimacula yallundae]|uniref:Uncharacterized protein n=1 Tax=Oculimacula yallundae TaxID=86028 RepID=A0ABR4CJ19_9HELO